ncbi:phage/plasmid primase, P4 family, C-terminal domain protein [delta proteobacterium NaphS2]|nr:phage/plasmid primase, P4 family, C-terminal domain protein [delta proteobacterium NaphS2]
MPDEMADVYRTFFHLGEVTEIRALGLRGKNPSWEGFCGGAGVVSGYFNDADAFSKAGAALDGAGASGVYFTLNPVKPDLLARSVNRLKGAPKFLTTDADIECLRWLPIDLDPVRPAGISSTDAELKRAADVAREVASWLENDLGFPKGIRACSGNGYHLTYRLSDLPNDEAHKALIKNSIDAVSDKFGTDQVEIDRKVGNPSRIWKCYSTSGRKGDSTKDRPHRKSYLFSDQATSLDGIGIVSIDALKKLASTAPEPDQTPKAKPPSGGQRQKSDLGPLDVEKYLNHFGIPFNLKAGKGGVAMYRLSQCLFDPNHGKNEASITQAPDGMLSYQCFHSSCSDKTWHDARRVISGEKSLAEYCEGYNPQWKPHTQKTTGIAVGNGAGDPGFLVENERGRIKFIPAKMANYLESQLKPVIYEGNDFSRMFFRYHASGVWRSYPKDAIRKFVRRLLGDHAKPAWLDSSVDVLASQVFKMPEELEFNPMLLNIANGMLHVETMEIKPHSPDYNSRVQLPVSFRKDATCTRWIEAIAQIFSDDLSKADVLQEFFGYALYPRILFPCCIFQIGQGRNGKGVVEKILCAMLGRANVSHVSLARMEENFGPVEIEGKLLNSCGETEAKPLDVTNFKKIVAGDEIQAQRKYLPDVKFTPIAKHLVSMNAFPGVKEKTDAFFRRIIVLEYRQKFEGEDDDKRLVDKLLEELDGIFKWSLEGLKRVLAREEIASPEAVSIAKERFREKVNPVIAFVKEACMLDVDAIQTNVKVLPADLYRAYGSWMEEAKLRSLGKNNFYEQILLNFPHVKKRRDGTRELFFGIGLLGSNEF